MATYLGKHGSKIQNYTTNPDNPNEGEVWYNETDNVLKFVYPNITSAGSWRTGVSVNSSRRGLGSNGTYTSSLIYGGYESDYSGKTESWNGSAWSEVNDLNNARNGNTGAGADSTAAVTMGGYSSTLNYTGVTELWNGTNWTEVNDLNTAREGANSSNAGIQTAALFAGGHRGNPPPNVNTNLVESWNGSNWTEVNDLNTAREHVANTGTSTSALAYAGNAPPLSAATELWNGTNWAEQNDLSTARTNLAKAGNTTNALAVTGGTPGNTAVVEEWTAAGVAVGAWSTGGTMNTARNMPQGAGTQTAGLAFGGSSPVTGVTETYDGSTWTEVNDMNTARGQGGGSGTQTSALVYA